MLAGMDDDGPRSKAPILAIGAATIALLTSIGAVVLILTRDRPAAPATAAPVGVGSASGSAAGSGAAKADSPGVVDVSIAATDVLKLKQRDLIEDAADGIQVSDETLRKALKLEADDIITAIGGRTVHRELEIYDAMMGLTMSETTAVYVDILRDGKPMLQRWKLDVSMRTAWRSSLALGSASPYSDPFGSARPQPTQDPDPDMIDSITKVDDTQVEAPRKTVDALFAFNLRGARVVPSIKNGVPNGIKLYAIRPNSLYSAAGLSNGDTITAINGQETPSIDKVIEAYGKVKTAPRLTLDIIRRGKDMTLTIVVK